MLKIFLIFTISLLIVIAIPNIYADDAIKSVQEKYVITKYESWIFHSIDVMQIELVNLNQTKVNNEQTRTFEIMKTDFVATSSGKISSVAPYVSSENLQIFENLDNRTELTKITVPSSTKFHVTTNIDETDTGTYSGKIYLLSKSQVIPIKIEIQIVHDFREIIIANIIGLGIATGLFYLCKSNKHKFLGNYEFNPGDNHPILIVITSMISIPATLLVSTMFVGIPVVDNIIAFGTGSIIVAKMIKKKKDEIGD